MDISVSPRRINEIVHGKRTVTDTALRQARYFGGHPTVLAQLASPVTGLDIEADRLGNRLDSEIAAHAS